MSVTSVGSTLKAEFLSAAIGSRLAMIDNS